MIEGHPRSGPFAGRCFSLVVAATVAATVAASGPALADKIGITSAVQPEVRGTPPEAEVRILKVGLDIVANELIETGGTGKTQIIFRDGTTLTLGPNTSLTIDKLIYDPSTKFGELAINAVQGVLFLVGGQISKQTPIMITTPSAITGVRGGIALIAALGPVTTSTLLFGVEMTMTSGGVTKRVSRPGYQIRTAAVGRPPADPAPAPEGDLLAALDDLESSGGDGGLDQVTDDDIGATGLAEIGSDLLPVEVDGGAGQTGGEAPTDTVAETTTTVAADVADASQDQTADVTAAAPGAFLALSGGSGRNPRFDSFDFDLSFGLFVGANLGTFSDGDIDLPGAGETFGTFTATSDGAAIALPTQVGFFQFGAASTATPFGPVSGRGFVADNAEFFAYIVAEQATGNPAFAFGGVPTPAAVIDGLSGFQAFEISTPALAFEFTTPTDNSVTIPFLPPGVGGTIGNAQVSPIFAAYDGPRNVLLQSTVAIDGEGANQRSSFVVWTAAIFEDSNGNDVASGFTRAFVRTDATARPLRANAGVGTAAGADGANFFGSDRIQGFFLVGDSFGDQVDQLAPGADLRTRRAVGGLIREFGLPATRLFDHAAFATEIPLPAGVGASRTDQTLNGYVGGLSERRRQGVFSEFALRTTDNDPSNVAIQFETATSKIEMDFLFEDASGAGDNFQIQFGGLDTFFALASFIDDQRFGARAFAFGDLDQNQPFLVNGQAGNFFNGGAVSSTVVAGGGTFFPSTVTICACPHTQWGFWAVAVGFNDAGGFFVQDRIHLATFVTGTLPGLGDIPAAGAATYVGSVIGNVANNGVFYITAGNLEITYDFALDTGTADVTDFDGANFLGIPLSASNPPINRREFTGFGAGSVAARNISMAGSFFSGGGDPVAAAAGNFDILDAAANYRAGGTFMVDRQ